MCVTFAPCLSEGLSDCERYYHAIEEGALNLMGYYWGYNETIKFTTYYKYMVNPFNSTPPAATHSNPPDIGPGGALIPFLARYDTGIFSVARHLRCDYPCFLPTSFHRKQSTV